MLSFWINATADGMGLPWRGIRTYNQLNRYHWDTLQNCGIPFMNFALQDKRRRLPIHRPQSMLIRLCACIAIPCLDNNEKVERGVFLGG